MSYLLKRIHPRGSDSSSPNTSANTEDVESYDSNPYYPSAFMASASAPVVSNPLPSFLMPWPGASDNKDNNGNNANDLVSSTSNTFAGFSMVQTMPSTNNEDDKDMDQLESDTAKQPDTSSSSGKGKGKGKGKAKAPTMPTKGTGKGRAPFPTPSARTSSRIAERSKRSTDNLGPSTSADPSPSPSKKAKQATQPVASGSGSTVTRAQSKARAATTTAPSTPTRTQSQGTAVSDSDDFTVSAGSIIVSGNSRCATCKHRSKLCVFVRSRVGLKWRCEECCKLHMGICQPDLPQSILDLDPSKSISLGKLNSPSKRGGAIVDNSEVKKELTNIATQIFNSAGNKDKVKDLTFRLMSKIVEID